MEDDLLEAISLPGRRFYADCILLYVSRAWFYLTRSTFSRLAGVCLFLFLEASEKKAAAHFYSFI